MNPSHSATKSPVSLCPLCEDSAFTCLDVFPAGDLQIEYARQLGVDIRGEFAPDVQTFELRECENCHLQYFFPLCTGSPAFYARLSDQEAYYSRSRWEFDETISSLAKSDVVVDVGCGDGHFLSLLPQEKKLGLEFNPEAVSKAHRRGLDVRCADLTSLPAACADAVTLFQVLEHVGEPVTLLRAAIRVLRSGGKLFVAVPNNDGFIGEVLHDPLNAPPHHVLRWTAASLCYVPRVLPLKLERLAVEPLPQENLFHYRRTWITRAVSRFRGRPIPRMRLSPGMVFLRRASNLLARVAVNLYPRMPEGVVAGHSFLAAYRKM